jgi:hypothetical protein
MQIPGAHPIPDAEAEMNRLAAERKLPEHIRKALGDAVTIVKPGETLIIRTKSLTPQQMREYQHALDDFAEYRQLPFQVLVVHGDDLAVGEAGR